MSDDIYKSLTQNQREYKLQVLTVEQLPIWYPGLLFFHVPNKPGGETDAERAKDGFFKKKMGVKTGMSDLVVSWRELDPYLKEKYGITDYWKLHAGLIELKAPGGTLGSDQNKILSSYSAIGWHTAVCYSCREVWGKLKSWGLKPASTAIREPDYRTLDEKFKLAAEFQSPPKTTSSVPPNDSTPYKPKNIIDF